MTVKKTASGKWEARERTGGRGSHRPSRTFDRKKDAELWAEDIRRRRQLGKPLDQPDVRLDEFIFDYWRLHATPNLRPSTRAVYRSLWGSHIEPRLGRRELRSITPRVLTRFRADLETAGVGPAAVRKTLALVQSILSFAVVEERVEFNAMSSVRKPHYERAREPVIFTPVDVEELRAKLNPLSSMLVSLLAYTGARPEEALRLTWQHVGTEAVRFDGQKTRRPRWTPLLAPLAQDLREWRLASGAAGRPKAPVIPDSKGQPWSDSQYRNWRRRVWHEKAPEGTRPRDLRSSYVTVQVYSGTPLTTLSRHVGTSVAMLDRHYAGVLANVPESRVPADEQIMAARRQLGLDRRTG